MKRKIATSKKIFAFILSVNLVVGLFAGMPMSATAATAVLNTSKSSYDTMVKTAGIVKTTPTGIYYYRSSTSEQWSEQLVSVSPSVYNNSSVATDVGTAGDYRRSFADYNTSNTAIKKVHADGTLRYLDVTYDLGTACKISGIAIGAVKNATYGNEVALGKYKIFAYNEKADIDVASSLLYDYDYSKATKDASNPYLYQTYTTDLTARFITIRITRATVLDASKYTSDTSLAVPKFFCGIYGKRSFDYSVKTGTYTSNDNVFGDVGASVVCADPKIYVSHYNESTKSFERKTTYCGNISYLWDGNIENENAHITLSAPEAKFATGEAVCHSCQTAYEAGSTADKCPSPCGVNRKVGEYYLDGSKHYVDIEHDLLDIKQIKNIVIANHKDKMLQTSAYRIYASTDLEDLYMPESLVYERTNALSPQKQQIINFSSTSGARYVAIRIYNPVGSGDAEELRKVSATEIYTNVYVRLAEFNIFGTEPYSVLGSMLDIPQYNEVLKSKRSLIEGANPVSSFCYSKGSSYSLNEAIYEVDEEGKFVKDDSGNNIRIETEYPNFAILTNDDVVNDDEIRGYNGNLYYIDEDGNFIDDETLMYAQFNYELDSQATISSVDIYGHTNARISPSHIKYSIADAEEDLFTEKAKFTTGDIRGSGRSLGAELKVPVEGKFVGIRIISGLGEGSGLNKGSSYLRIREISIYGEYTDAAILPKVYNAIYHENGIRKETNSEAITVSGRLDTSGNAPAGSAAVLKAPVSVRYNGDIYSFSGWVNENGDVLCETTAYNYELTNQSVTLNAAYKKETDKTVTYNFEDKNGNVIYTATVLYGHYLSREQYNAANAAIPDIPGYEVKTEVVSFGSRTAKMPVWSEDIYNHAAEMNVTFTPVYVAESTKYTVTYRDSVEEYVFDARVHYNEASASSWTVNKIPYATGTTFTAYVTGDMEIEALTESTSQVISLFDKAYVKGGDIAVFARFINIPASAFVTECGIVFAGGNYLSDSDYTSGSYSKFVVGGEGFQTVKAEKYSTANGFSVNLQNVGRKRTRIARAYVTYNVLGSTQTVYSNVIVAETK